MSDAERARFTELAVFPEDVPIPLATVQRLWERTGRLNVFHYGYGRMMPVHYGLYTDARGYDCANAALRMPILIVQGRRDTAVDPAGVEEWARTRPNVELHLLDDDHQLASSLEVIWKETRRFLNL